MTFEATYLGSNGWLIKFKETRNYVQRVLENYNVYRYILSQKPIYLKDFFKNQSMY